jgi:hypothetical protein
MFDHAVNKRRMLIPSDIYVFSNHEEVDRKPVSEGFCRFLARYTRLCQYNEVLPVNPDTVLTELRVDTVKTATQFRWFWENTGGIQRSENTYHAFRDAYTHATIVPVYLNIARHFMSVANTARLMCMDGRDTAAVKAVMYAWLQTYFSAHPLLPVMDREIAENTKDHLVNQMVIMGFRERSRMPKLTDKGEGMVRSRPTFDRGLPEPFNGGRPAPIEEAPLQKPLDKPYFQRRVPSKTLSPEGTPIASA